MFPSHCHKRIIKEKEENGRRWMASVKIQDKREQEVVSVTQQAREKKKAFQTLELFLLPFSVFFHFLSFHFMHNDTPKTNPTIHQT